VHAPDTPQENAAAARESAGARRWTAARITWHAVGLVLAAVLAWLIVRAYRQPDFIIDLVNTMLC
jgi:hypothetical protein